MNRREAILAGSALAATAAMPTAAATARPIAPQMITVWHQGKEVGGCFFQGGDVIENARSAREWVARMHRSDIGMAAQDCEVRLEWPVR